MTIVERFFSAIDLVGAAGGAFYGINTEDPQIFPYVTMQRIASTSNVTLLGPSDLQSTRMQIDVFSLSIKEADTLMHQIDAAMQSVFGADAVPGVSQDLYEAPVKAWRITKDYSVMSTD